MDLKISDFGLSKKGNYQMDLNERIPIKWTSPEALKMGLFTKASDIWSFGVLMWEIFADAAEPWPELTNKETYRAVISGQRMEYPKSAFVPEGIKDIMQETWNLNPDKRPNVTVVRRTLETIAKAHGGIRPDLQTIHSTFTSGKTM
ncbi:MAG: protein kinase [Gammaproteobacteria bacterium]|nr:protein kinase [Gammaproteobacteria bacterium]